MAKYYSHISCVHTTIHKYVLNSDPTTSTSTPQYDKVALILGKRGKNFVPKNDYRGASFLISFVSLGRNNSILWLLQVACFAPLNRDPASVNYLQMIPTHCSLCNIEAKTLPLSQSSIIL